MEKAYFTIIMVDYFLEFPIGRVGSMCHTWPRSIRVGQRILQIADQKYRILSGCKYGKTNELKLEEKNRWIIFK